MSNAFAIAAVTTTLRRLIEQNLPDTLSGATVTTKPPDKALTNNNGTNTASNNQLNLFLYQTELHPQWRNQFMPGQVLPGETGQPPLALNLHYLLTAYGQDDDDTLSHQLLGRAMSTLHDHPILTTEEIRLATETDLPDSNLHQQVECVRITPQPISLEDLSKLWATFQTQYRISATYQVSVILIESTRPSRTPQPVLTRGSLDDSGVEAQSNLTLPYPDIQLIRLPNQQPSLRLSDGEPITLVGQNFGSSELVVRLRHSSFQAPVEFAIAAADHTATEIPVTIPNAPDLWPAGYYAVSVQLEQVDGERTITRISNEIPFSIAPEISALAASRDGDGVTVTVTCTPAVLLELLDPPASPGPISIPLEQQVFLNLFDETNQLPIGDNQLSAEPFAFDTSTLPGGDPLPASTTTLTFRLGAVAPGTYPVRPRLRVGDTDSLMIQDYTVRPPRFIDYQDLVIP
ncbi:MAG: DUF4255 domain-containing protein [Leptolyngbya sp. SIO1D8]|nr:DUF4255 domain-containing protein [Leptolyngbya sp. SIO1D8]